MANGEVEASEQTTNMTVGEYYETVADLVDSRINGITDVMRSTILHVRNGRRGVLNDMLNTTVYARRPYGRPLTRQKLLYRWVDLSLADGTVRTTGFIDHTHEIRAGRAKLHQSAPNTPVIASYGLQTAGNGIQPRRVEFNPENALTELEPDRITTLLKVTSVILSHVNALQQLTDGQPTVEVLGRLSEGDRVPFKDIEPADLTLQPTID